MQRVGAQRPPPLLRLARPPGAAFGSTVGGWFRPGPLSPLTAFLSQRYTGFPGGHLGHVPGSRGRALATFRPASEASPLAHSVEARPRPSRVDGVVDGCHLDGTVAGGRHLRPRFPAGGTTVAFSFLEAPGWRVAHTPSLRCLGMLGLGVWPPSLLWFGLDTVALWAELAGPCSPPRR